VCVDEATSEQLASHVLDLVAKIGRL
jgi:outer membrane murein-binding lipoprotein Lpp